MAPSDISLPRKARRAYELGRLRSAALRALRVLPVAALMLWMHPGPQALALLGVLAVTVLALLWRGGAYGRAATTGLLAGAVPLVAPVLVRSGGHCCIAGLCAAICMVACVGAGLVAGAVVALRAGRERGEHGTFMASAAFVAGLTGVLGCTVMGAAGILGMLAGLLVASVPVAVRGALAAR
ncbi:MAG: hypothetical protein WKG00_11435 [Polyangiaceae bacterium]